ncbi:MAG TPA: GNAT family N-acetyltransferase [Stellaceae bacterium]|nr:GNAT family N-acetyltransferase [Stellaceae bacterium]
MSEVTVAEERPVHGEAVELLRQFAAFSAALYPPKAEPQAEADAQADASSLLADNVRFFVARRDGKALGCMALVRTGPDKAELRRCFVTEAARGQGVGYGLLQASEAAARAQQLRLIQLETGNRNIAALRLYRGCGYHDRGPFGAYPDNGVSVFLEKTL